MPKPSNKHLYWAEIGLGALESNYHALKEFGGEERELICVIKSNAYGHGLAEVARHLYALGARKFAVSCFREAIDVDGCLGDNHSAEILILGYTPPAFARELGKGSIIQSVGSLRYAEELRLSAGYPLNVHIKLDTGMHRRGICVGESNQAESEISEIFSLHSVLGAYTHLHSADGNTNIDRERTTSQISLFDDATASMPDELTRHILNSAGVIRYIDTAPRALTEVIRPGIALYGVSPSSEMRLPSSFVPSLSLYTVIAEIKDVHPGESIGYGATFTAEKKMRIAILPIGYGEGYKRSLSGRGSVLIKDTPCPVVGRVCMNMTAVDISEVSDATVGDTVTVIGGELSASELAEAADTISYDILTSVSQDITRIYI